MSLRTLVLLAFASCISTASAASERPLTVVVMGDSISAAYGIQREQGWVALMDQRLREYSMATTVVNASLSGETTAGGRVRMSPILEAHQPDIVILELGGNDGLRGYPIEMIRENMEVMAKLARDQGAEVIILGMAIPANYGPRYTNAFRAVFVETSSDTGSRLVPFPDGIATVDELMQADGIHPNAKAQSKLLDNVWPVLKRVLNDRSNG
ncbi:MAG: arylesterase [Pseudomonadales bacterium]|nr:arylesterase [Pseudomonadales bacterium]